MSKPTVIRITRDGLQAGGLDELAGQPGTYASREDAEASKRAPIASGRVCRDWGEWHARVPDDILGDVFDLGGIDGESVLMSDLHPEVVAAYLSKPLPRGAAA